MKEDFSYNPTRSNKYSTDVQSVTILREYCSITDKIPAKVSKGNNSLFAAVSVALTGHEKLSTELRVRCCIEMNLYSAFHRWQDKYNELSMCSPEYDDSCLNCASPDGDSCVWAMSALATVVRKQIHSVYPPVNGPGDFAAAVLNRTFSPRSKLDSGEQILIFWSNTDSCLTPGFWMPDIFVPLLGIPALSPVISQAQLTPSRVSGRVRKPTPKMMAITNNSKERCPLKVFVDDPESTIRSVDENGGNDLDSPAEVKLEPVDEPSDSQWDLQQYDCNWMNKFTHTATGGKPLNGTAFLPATDIFSILTTETKILSAIPPGRKKDVYFVIDNSKNTKHRNRRNHFYDDCGRYSQKNGTTCKSFYVINEHDKFQPLIKYDHKYCKEKRRTTLSGSIIVRNRGRPPSCGRGRGVWEGVVDERSAKWIPLDPQPREDDVIILNRYYSVLEVDPSYKRRISWLVNLPNTFMNGHNVFLAEYLTKPTYGVHYSPPSQASSNLVSHGLPTSVICSDSFLENCDLSRGIILNMPDDTRSSNLDNRQCATQASEAVERGAEFEKKTLVTYTQDTTPNEDVNTETCHIEIITETGEGCAHHDTLKGSMEDGESCPSKIPRLEDRAGEGTVADGECQTMYDEDVA